MQSATATARRPSPSPSRSARGLRGWQVLGCALLVSLPACSAPAPRGFIHITEERAAFGRAEAAWLKDDYLEAAALFEEFLIRWPRSARRAEALLYSGLCSRKLEDPEQAQRYLEQAHREGEGAVAARALLEIGQIALDAEHFGSAADRFARAREHARDPETRGEAALLHGIALQKEGRFEEARRILDAVGDDATLPEGITAQARYRAQIEPFFTVQVGAFARRSNAEALLGKLAEKGIEARIVKPGERGDPLYRVTAGRFSSRRQAREQLARLAELLEGEKPLIVP